MSLTAGSRVGPYEITGSLGAGGMGEVYRARDTRLDRTVAIKILSPDLTARLELRERFEREARAVAALNHPYICTLYDVGHQEGTDFLVMEYLEGETLEQRLQRGPLPVDQGLQLAVQIATALDVAHRAGIVHRDLKPGNVMLTKSGSGRQGSPQAKLLDFGLAKTTATTVAGRLSMLPTTPPGLTAQGTILGTLQYMAPEQLEGQDADARTDIFAFGAVLYEMFTGKKAFEGKSQASLIGAILRDTPALVTAAQPLAPSALDAIVSRCLEKNPADRWQSIADLRFTLTAFIGAAAPAVTTASTARSRAWLWAGAAGLAVAAAAAGWFGQRLVAPEPPSSEPVRFSITAPPGTRFDILGNFNPNPVISPDGRMVAYLARASDNSGVQLWIRRLDGEESVRIDGTEGANFPFWSPDSTTLAFFAQGELRLVDIAAGAARPLMRVDNGLGGAWSPDGTILIGQNRGPLLRTSVSGVAPDETTDLAPGEISHISPRFLPDGRHFLFRATGQGTVYVAGPEGTEARPLLTDVDSFADFVSPGYLLFVRESALMAQRFDPARLELQDAPFVVADQTVANFWAGFSASTMGDVVYATGNVPQRQLVWVDRRGVRLAAIGDPAPYRQVSLSPDNRRIAVDRQEPGRRQYRLWLLDAERGLPTRFTANDGGGDQGEPTWTPNSNGLIFVSGDTETEIHEQSIGGGASRLLLRSEARILPEALSPDGATLLYDNLRAGIWRLNREGEPKPTSYLPRPGAALDEPEFSPDGEWVAYSANDSGQAEIYIQAFPKGGERVRASTRGGQQPHWRGDGRELFYVEPNGDVIGVPVEISGSIRLGAPVRLFALPLTPTRWLNEYAVSRDGQRFLVQVPDTAGDSLRIVVTTNWASSIPVSR